MGTLKVVSMALTCVPTDTNLSSLMYINFIGISVCTTIYKSDDLSNRYLNHLQQCNNRKNPYHHCEPH